MGEFKMLDYALLGKRIRDERKRQKKYKEKAIKKNNGEELNEFFTKTEDEENDNLQILNDIQYK